MFHEPYQFQVDLIAPLRSLAKHFQSTLATTNWGAADNWRTNIFAGMEMPARFKITHTRPDFAIDSVVVANRDVAVTTETVVDLPFGKLVRFSKDVEKRQPRVLVLAPLSGHFATLLFGTIRTLLSDHEVSVTDWANARDVPLVQGHFGMGDYVSYIMRFLEVLGPRTLGEGNLSTSAQFYFVGSMIIQPPLAMVNEQMNEFQLA